MKAGSIVVRPESPDSYSVEIHDGHVLSIGRKPGSNGTMRLILPFPEVSSQHAEIRCKPEVWTIVDQGSTNGTTLNGARLTAGREYALRDRDVVGIAQYELVISAPDNFADTLKLESEQEKTQFRIHLINATILVGDIKHFSGLMEAYASNPDRVMQAASMVFDRLNEEIHRNYGHLEKIAGDAIMAYWHGDDSKPGASMQAYQACHTALQLKIMTERLAKDFTIWPFKDFPLMMDMALATGPVASGAIGTAQGNPALLGDTANVVFRLEKLIGDDKPGDIVVEQATYELAREHFDFNFLGDFTVKGRQKPVSVYQLVGLVKK